MKLHSTQYSILSPGGLVAGSCALSTTAWVRFQGRELTEPLKLTLNVHPKPG